MQIELIGSKMADASRRRDVTNPDDMSQYTDPSNTKTKIVSSVNSVREQILPSLPPPPPL